MKFLHRAGGTVGDDHGFSILLPELVNIGRPGRREGTRELAEWAYTIVYKADDDCEIVTILTVVRGATLDVRRHRSRGRTS